MRSPSQLGPVVAAGFALAASLLAPRLAHAQRELLDTPGSRGTLVIDQVAGFRASTVRGFGYASPIGFSTQSFSVDQTNGSVKDSFTTFWFAPSADYFVIDHLSVGGVIEVATTSVSETVTVGGVSRSTDQPTITSFTFLPRVGWMFGITDRFGIWPRLGLGYASQSRASNIVDNASSTYSAFVFDVDVGFLYRINENWFIKGAPELTLGPGSVSTRANNNTTISNSASLFQFAVVGGVGVMWDLL